MNIKDFAEKFIKAEEEAFQKGNFDALAKLEDTNVVYHMGAPLGDLVGHEAHRHYITGARQTVSNLKQEFKYLAGDGNLFAFAYKSSGQITGEISGVPMPIGKKVSTDYLFVIRVNKGRVAEVWANGSTTISD